MMKDEHMVVKKIMVALCAAYTLNSFAKMNNDAAGGKADKIKPEIAQSCGTCSKIIPMSTMRGWTVNLNKEIIKVSCI